MPSILPDYEYDIFISYRHKDNRSDQWVTKFVEALKEELDATFKQDISIYFDENPHNGLGATHDVDDSLAKKLRCLILIPIISKTYCDPECFAWENEFLVFNELASKDEFGLKVPLANGNTASRVLPVKIHNIDDADTQLIENEIGFLRPIEFVYESAGVNRPLNAQDSPEYNLNAILYRDQINKVGNAIHELLFGLQSFGADARSTKTVKGQNDDQASMQQAPSKIKEPAAKSQKSKINAPLSKLSKPIVKSVQGENQIRSKQSPAYILAPILIFLMLASGYIAWILKPTPAKQVMRFSIMLKDEIRHIGNIALSHDGNTLIIGATMDGFAEMFVRPINAFESYRVPGGSGANHTFSMDDSEVAFSLDGGIKVYSIETGTVSHFGDAVSISNNGITWIGDSIVYAPGVGSRKSNRNLMQISRGRSENRVYISPNLEKGELDLNYPHYILNTNKLLFQISKQTGSYIQLLDISTMQYSEVIKGRNPKFVASGYMLFEDGGKIMGINFDPDNPENSGKPVMLVSGVDAYLYAVSENGTLGYVEFQEEDRQPFFVDTNGVMTAIPMPKISRYASPRWSPDGSKIVFHNPSTNSLWIYNLDKGTSQLLLNNQSNTSVWLPDSKNVAFRSSNDLILSINILNPNEVDTLLRGEYDIYPTSFSSDGSLMLYDEIHSFDKKNILLYDVEKDESRVFIKSSSGESMAQFSPDDEWVIYSSDETGQTEIYLRRFQDTGEKWLISDDGGSEPRWSKDGREIFYRNGNRIMRVSIQTGDQLDYGNAVMVLEGLYPPSPWGISNYEISQDGKEFLMLMPVSTGRKEIRIVVNWFEELKELMEE